LTILFDVTSWVEMPKFLHSIILGIGTAVNVFPARDALQVEPVTGDYFGNAGEHLRVAMMEEGPRLRQEAAQMELHLGAEASPSH
jgi:hypothetical protein